MAESISAPRITAQHLDAFAGRLVTMVGKVTQLRGDQATIDADGTVTVVLNRDAHLSNGNAVQIIGKVNPDLSIKVLSSKDLGPGVGLSPPSPSAMPHLSLTADRRQTLASAPPSSPPRTGSRRFSSRRAKHRKTMNVVRCEHGLATKHEQYH
ncbi:hypothetical protein DCS_02012 [Drechmeria coniospora]|uniref:DNA replication factor A subunit Ssb3 n=1 Tax=Drechmeria coniospora TaxID=98403 RepID=A0A151GUT1_DRECN|nr:hypothetical protein DCS_02012 [Drechmeria coniospora]KYK60874.1 hypothetical protein DCS_02012 [Drechmeria coniospora]